MAALKGLRELNLSGIPATDAGLKHLAALTQLRTLSLSGTRVTDVSMTGPTIARVAKPNDA